MLIVTKDAEVKLLEVANTLKADASGYYAILFRFSKLQEQYRSTYQIKIALNIVKDLFLDIQGGAYLMRNFDLILLYKGEDRLLLEKTIFQLRYLFVDDPLAYDVDGEENEEFCAVFDLNFRWRDFYMIAREKMGLVARGQVAVDPLVATPKPIVPAPEHAAEVHLTQQEKTQPEKSQLVRPTTPMNDLESMLHMRMQASGNRSFGSMMSTEPIPEFSSMRLALVERDLDKADLQSALRRQPICAALKGQSVRPVYDEVYIHIEHLRRLLNIESDVMANRGLFKYLTGLLDKYVLDALGKNPKTYLATPVSINLNVETLLSEDFAAFRARIKAEMAKSVIVEIHVGDVFADMALFNAARNTAQEFGFRVCIDGLTSLSVQHIDRSALGFDLAKVQWNPEMKVSVDTEANRGISASIAKMGANRIILCRCDNRLAIDYGQNLGISLFQGRYMDKMLDPDAKIVN